MSTLISKIFEDIHVPSSPPKQLTAGTKEPHSPPAIPSSQLSTPATFDPHTPTPKKPSTRHKILPYSANPFSCKKQQLILCSWTAPAHVSPNHSFGVLDVREEYANAFRTESYIDFWTRVIELSNGHCSPAMSVESTTAARLPSYRLFAEHLLDPNQATVIRILDLTHNGPKIHTLLSDYFTQTANTSILCGLLLKEIERTRVKYRSFKTTLQSLETAQLLPENRLSNIKTLLTECSNSINPFVSLISSPNRVRVVQSGCSGLLQRLESSRDKARAKLQLINKLKHGSALVLVALTASLSVIVVTHALSLVVAIPSLISASIELASARKLARVMAQLDAATKGTYILSRDLDTISRLVTRLNDELEHIRVMAKFWLDRGDDWLQASGEVARQLKRNESSFNEQLDELEEHLYLCFMTINRARNLVVKEILNPAEPTKQHYIL
ncbi:hypothetical protein L484_004321 [Morus notabilis]|uniref:Uncharacterized protein n=1 Tax=Morus notabilis TaxID=981085 RepID=W9S7Z2_9ROSA|nr:hypothetical protein L484_004321 [Morus notabilis]